MTTQIITVLLLSLLHVFFFKETSIGINLLIFHGIFSGTLFYLFPLKRRNPLFWFLNISLLGSSFSMGFYPNILSQISYYTTSILLAGSLHPRSASIPLAFCNGCYALTVGWVNNSKAYLQKIALREKVTLQKKDALIYGLPFAITLIFINLYSMANPAFRSLFTSLGNSIDIDLLSLFDYSFYFALSYCTLVAYITPLSNQKLVDQSRSFPDMISISQEQTRWLTQEEETKLSTILLGSLNVVLLLFHVTDLPHLFTAGPDSVTLSQYLHQGINTLSISVILATGILLYIFRNTLQLSMENKALRVAASAWLIQNSFLIATSVWKNIAYVAAYGLTYKRIGVFLFLCVVMNGLLTTITKINGSYSLWYYIKRNSQLGFATFAIAGLCNWDAIIANINTSSGIQADIDIRYLLEQNNPNVAWLDNYFSNHPEKLQEYHRIITTQANKFDDGLEASWKSWPNRNETYQQWYENWRIDGLATLAQAAPSPTLPVATNPEELPIDFSTLESDATIPSKPVPLTERDIPERFTDVPAEVQETSR